MLPKLRRPATVQGVSLVIGMGTAHMSMPVARRHHRTPWLQCEMSMLFARQGRNHKAVMAVQLTLTCAGKCLAWNCGGWPPQEHEKRHHSTSLIVKAGSWKLYVPNQLSKDFLLPVPPHNLLLQRLPTFFGYTSPVGALSLPLCSSAPRVLFCRNDTTHRTGEHTAGVSQLRCCVLCSLALASNKAPLCFLNSQASVGWRQRCAASRAFHSLRLLCRVVYCCSAHFITTWTDG